MNRRSFLKLAVIETICLPPVARLLAADLPTAKGAAKGVSFRDTPTGRDWLARWEKSILGDARSRSCDKEMGEELGWLVSPFLNGFYYGHLATGDPKWIDLLIDWTDSCILRGVKEPDGFLGWPKGNGGGGESQEYSADSLLGEAMMLRPVVLMAARILGDPALDAKYGVKARSHLDLAERTFEKWDSRGCWREVKEGGVWIVPDFGIDLKTGSWSAGYAERKTNGFTNPANKENHIARWMLALHDTTKKPVYRDRAEQWFRVMRSRIRTREEGKYSVWNYWDPAGPWDYQPNGAPKHWVGVHPNGGYYQIDVEGIVGAYQHGLVFTKADIDRLIATNRDFMWNQKIDGAKFQRIDGGEVDARWKNSPGALWPSLVPYDETLRAVFIANHDPSGWGGIGGTPWFLAEGDRR
jgi:hypothetical protein